MHCTVDRLVLSGVESVRKYYKDSSGGNNYVHLLTSTVHEYNCEVFVLYLSIWIQCYFILSIEILYFLFHHIYVTAMFTKNKAL